MVDPRHLPIARQMVRRRAGATIRGQHRGDNRHGLLLALDQEPLELPARTLLHGRTRLPDSTHGAQHHENPLMHGAHHRGQRTSVAGAREAPERSILR